MQNLSDDIKLQDLLQETVLKINADYAEIRAEQNVMTRIVYRGENPELIAEPSSLGFFVRVLVNGSWGISTFSDFTQLKKKVEEAIISAKLQGKGSVVLANTPQHVATVNYTQIKDFRSIELKQKVNLVKKYNDILLKGSNNIQSTSSIYADQLLTKFFVNSRGSRILQTRPYCRLSYAAIAREGDTIEQDRGSEAHLGGFEIVEGLEEKMESVSKGASLVAKAPKVKSGVYSVILDPLMAGTFAHEAFGHFSEADHQYENPDLLKQMAIGNKLGSDEVNITDDPSMNGGWGNFVYDDEGVLAKPQPLLTRGVITGRLHSLETAGALNEMPNGRARADGFSKRPIPRMSNTFFVPGKYTKEELIKSIDKGVLVVSWIAGMTAMEQFTFTGLYGIMIEKGKLTEKVRGVKLSGNVFETLKNIDGVSNDFEHDAGTCGKAGQHMSVGSGGSHIRIHNVSVGGE